MAIYVAGAKYAKAFFAGAEISKWLVAAAEYFTKVVAATHTFTMRVGQSGNAAGASRGYNAPANFGSIAAGSSAQYDTPGGKSVTIIHCRRVGAELNFSLNPVGNSANDFPVRIVVTKISGGEVKREFTRQAGSFRPVSGGFRYDYDAESGSPTDVFVNNQNVKVELFY